MCSLTPSETLLSSIFENMTLSRVTLVIASFIALPAHVNGKPKGIEPAAQLVPETTATGAPLLKAESFQLTDAILNRISEDPQTSLFTDLFAFDDDRAIKTQAGACKIFPGDQDWPSANIWDIFNKLLGGGLISTIPIAASCYDSEWGPKDLAKCNAVISSFGMPPTQYVLLQVYNFKTFRNLSFILRTFPSLIPSCG